MAPLCYAAKFYPSLTLVCARVGEANKGKEGIKFCHLATLAEIALYTTYLLPLFALSPFPIPLMGVRADGRACFGKYPMWE